MQWTIKCGTVGVTEDEATFRDINGHEFVLPVEDIEMARKLGARLGRNIRITIAFEDDPSGIGP